MTRDLAVEIISKLKEHLVLDRPEERVVDEAFSVALAIMEISPCADED